LDNRRIDLSRSPKLVAIGSTRVENEIWLSSIPVSFRRNPCPVVGAQASQRLPTSTQLFRCLRLLGIASLYTELSFYFLTRRARFRSDIWKVYSDTIASHLPCQTSPQPTLHIAPQIPTNFMPRLPNLQATKALDTSPCFNNSSALRNHLSFAFMRGR
jgi:hypothetical protein